MTIQLRQICLVAKELNPVIDDLTDVLGIKAALSTRASALWS
ncbi:MAG: hypothetical protein Ct9H300mP8_02630 [Gammaproteobacteria bacterium]|nr:MAG: hypothetical protein Ct9H300mP8_02630 [Gammaproteobacteria bacterium]